MLVDIKIIFKKRRIILNYLFTLYKAIVVCKKFIKWIKLG
jgi:hypothetical protein